MSRFRQLQEIATSHIPQQIEGQSIGYVTAKFILHNYERLTPYQQEEMASMPIGSILRALKAMHNVVVLSA